MFIAVQLIFGYTEINSVVLEAHRGDKGWYEVTKEALARGPNFIYAKEYIQKEYGELALNRVLADLPEDMAEVWDRAVLLTLGVYPFAAFKAMTFALAKELGTPEDAEIARMYEYIADRSLSFIHKMFFKVATPAFAIGNYPKLWDRFFATGKVEVPLLERGRAKVKFILPEIFLDWLPPACLGYSKKAVEMAGGSNLRMEEIDRSILSDGEWEIVYELRWDE